MSALVPESQRVRLLRPSWAELDYGAIAANLAVDHRGLLSAVRSARFWLAVIAGR
jgi:hypothetical protein